MSLMQELLDIVSEENPATPVTLARRLNVSQGLVEMMLADLERAGYLQAVTSDCGSCTGCGLRQTCQTPQPRFWIRTGR
jgi:Mn-dependent DtxR family transcriptional regulator